MKNNLSQNLLFQWQVKLICLLLAICIYFLVSFSANSDRKVIIPLEIVLPTDLVAESLVPDSIDLVINGNENIIYLIDPSLVSAKADFSKVKKEGIAFASVILDYDDKVFSKGEITLNTNPTDIRISFKNKVIE